MRLGCRARSARCASDARPVARAVTLGMLTSLAGVFCPNAAAEIVVTNSGLAVGLLANHAPDFVCIGSGQYWMTGGAAIADFNNDLWPDVFMVGGGTQPDRLFINSGTGMFSDQAAYWGVQAFHGGNGVSAADFNNDGWTDLYVTSFGNVGQPGQPGKHKLYRNNGNGTFTDVAVAAGVNQTTVNVANGYGSAWGDYDLDGDLDLFVASWKDIIGLGNNGTGNKLFRNNGNETFTDVSATALGISMSGVWGFQPAFVDMNGDLYPEILLAADFDTSRYLINVGNGTFFNYTIQSGTGIESNGMGQAVADFDRDGLLDWYVTSIHRVDPPPTMVPGNMLYLNQGLDQYTEVSVPAGVNDGGWGWGALAVDLNRDGWMDIVEVNGRNAGEWANEQEYIYEADGDGTFTRLGALTGLDLAGDARCVAWLDAERDGDQDLVITVTSSTLRYYRNESNSGSWIHLTFDTDAHPLLPPHGFNTRVELTANGITHVQYFSGSPSYLGTSELALHFGLGDAKVIDQIKVHWSRGQVTTLTNVAVDQFLHISAAQPTDVTSDHVINVDDLLAVISAWGECPPPSICASDVNADGNVNVDDLLAVISNWD